jgi:hypothetical protein
MSAGTFIRRHRRLSLIGLASMGAASLVAAGGSGAFGSTVNTAVFSGGSGTFAQGSTLFAKQGADMALTVQTSADTQCVEVTGAQTAVQTSDKNPKSQWVFHFTAGSGDGVNTVTVAAAPNVNAQGKCTGQSRTLPAS